MKENLESSISSAIDYIVHLNQIPSNQQSKKDLIQVNKFKVDGGFIEHIGEVLKDGWIQNNYNDKNQLLVKQEAFIDNNDQIKELKFKTTKYNPLTGTIIESSIATNILMKEQLIGDYKAYYENGKIEVEGSFYDFFKNGHKTFFGKLRTGIWKWYMEDGDSFEEEYKVEIEYHSNGGIKKIYSLYFNPDQKTWIKHGLYYEFPQGEFSYLPSVTREYDDGILIKEK